MARITVYRNASTILAVEVAVDSDRTLVGLKMAIKPLRSDADNVVINGTVTDEGTVDESGVKVATGFFEVQASDLTDLVRGSYEYGGVATLDNGDKIALPEFNGRCWVEESGVEA